MMLRKVKLITFDVTNTLLKFRRPVWQYYKISALGHGFRGTDEELKTKLNKSMKLMIEKHPNYGKTSIAWENWWTEVVKMTLKDYLPLTADLNNIASDLINDFKTRKCWYLADHGGELVKLLKENQNTVGIISNFDPRLYDILQNFQIDKKFDFILTSYELGVSKPDKKIFEIALDVAKRNIEPSEALHVGDDVEKDYEGARAAGWQAVLINPDVDPSKYPHNHVFDSLENFYDTVKQCCYAMK